MRKLAFVVAAALGLTVFGAATASAHEDRLIANKYRFTVGWGDEPVYAGFKNSVQVLIEDVNGRPVNDVTDTLKVEIATGAQKTTLTMEPAFQVGVFGDEGDYRANLVPTRAGNYVFRFTGTIRGDTINETFRSGATTFEAVASQDGVQFPAKDPSAGDLNARLTREAARLASQAEAAQDDASQARTIAIAGVVVGLLGLAAGGVAVARRR